MEIMGDWHVYHRGAERLPSLAQECGIDHKDILIDQESEKVNVFLHPSWEKFSTDRKGPDS